VVLGSTVPRLFTPPLVTGPPGPCGCGCALTPETSVGFDQTEFAARVLHHPDDPWQRWAKIHAGELLPDGTERFKYRLILASRQNGKSEIVVTLAPYWLFVERVAGVLAASTKVSMAKKLWDKSRKLIRNCGLVTLLEKNWYRTANDGVEMWTPEKDADGRPWDSHYGVDASNEEGGRSLTLNRLVIDELRHHYDYLAWGALVRTMGAVDGSQAWLLSNAGSDRSQVLNDLREAVVTEVDGVEVVLPDPDTDFFIAEWSAEQHADPLDEHSLAQANPNMNRRGQRTKDLLADARRAVKAGGEALTEYKTEVMCIRVKVLNPAIDPTAWRDCSEEGDLEAVRNRVAWCLDVSPMGHTTLAAAALLPDGRVRGEAVADWDTPAEAREALPALVAEGKPRVFGWLPTGPAAELAVALADRTKKTPGPRVWPPPGVKVEEIRAETAACCMGFSGLVRARLFVHSDDPLVNDHVGAAEKLKVGDRWIFDRKGEEPVDAAYAMAGAAHLAQLLPPPLSMTMPTPLHPVR